MRNIVKRYIKSIIKKVSVAYRQLNFHKEILNSGSQPNGNADIVNDAYLSNNIKNIMAFYAEQRISEIDRLPMISAPLQQKLTSKLSTQHDLEATWCRYWMRELKLPFRYHRKSWEFGFVLQALFEHGMFGKAGVGLACGREVLPSYLIAQGCKITAGDKPLTEEDQQQQEWISSSQYTRSKDDLYHAHLIDRSTFDNNFTLVYVDMNDLPPELYGKFDFCWSVCAVEHLGSIRHGFEFMKDSLKLLRKGGISVHTTEFNLLSNSHTIDNWGSVLFTKEQLSKFSDAILQAGGTLYPFDFNIGDGFFDRYIDLPPYPYQSITGIDKPLPERKFCPHIKLLIDGFPATCAGIIIQKI